MDKLEFSKHVDRIKVLMDASGHNLEQMLAIFASDFIECDKCPLRVKCHPDSDLKEHISDITNCYITWLMYLEANDE